MKEFVNYAHRGASEYCPENTLVSFYTGIYMQANGIETDVQKTKDGILVLFHDDTVTRVTGRQGHICDYTFEQLQQFTLEKNGITDKIVSFEEFLKLFAFRDITFAIELKQPFIEKEVAEMIYRYHAENKCVVTSFDFENIKRMREYASELEIGYLTGIVDEDVLDRLIAIGGQELCPHSSLITEDNVAKWHAEGLRVRAWGITDEDIMKKVYDCGADGMTVNFPDKLQKYISGK